MLVHWSQLLFLITAGLPLQYSSVIGPDEYLNVRKGIVAVPGCESCHRINFLMWEPGCFPSTTTCWESTSVRKELNQYWWWFVPLQLRGLGVLAAEKLTSLTCAATLTKLSS